MNPYQVLGLDRDKLNGLLNPEDQAKLIKSAYRKLSRKHHPDAGGREEDFQQIKLAYDILSDPARRQRYDIRGRTDESKATPERIREFIRSTMRSVVDASRPDGSRDDPTRENIRDKVILGVLGARAEIKNRLFDAQRRLERVERLLERFKTLSDFDPVGDSLREEKDRVQLELMLQEDALEMSMEVEETLKSYMYEVSPGPEGQFSPGPATPKGGFRIMSYPGQTPAA